MIEIASKDPEIHSSLLAINYTDPKVEALRATWSAAKEATKTHKKAVDDQKEQGLKFKKTRWEANEIYMTHLRYAKIITHKDPEMATKLGLQTPRKKRLNDWLLQGTVFYSRVLAQETIVTAFDDRFGETSESIAGGEQAIANTDIERQEYNALIGNSQALRADRDEKLEKLDRDITGFIIVLRRAMKDNLQHLEKVGILVYTPGYKKKKKETEPPLEGPTGTDPQTTDPNAQTTDPNSQNTDPNTQPPDPTTGQ